MIPYFIQVFANSGLMAGVVYLPLLAKKMGASAASIGLLVGVYQGTMFFSNLLFGRWADFGDRKIFMVIGLAITALTVALHIPIKSLFGLFVIRFITGWGAGIFPAALVAYFYEDNKMLGRFSGFGSLGWATGALIVGLVSEKWIFLVAALAIGLTSVVALLGLRSQRVRLGRKLFNLTVLKQNWRIYLSFLLRHLGAFSIWTIFPVYLTSLGANRFWVGVVYALNPLGQFVFMNILEPYAEEKLIKTGLLLSILVFLAFGLVTDFRQVIPVQLVLALSWSCLYLGSLKKLMRTNQERSTAAGMLNSVLSLAAVLGALFEGATGNFGYRTVMFVAAGLASFGTIVYFVTREAAN